MKKKIVLLILIFIIIIIVSFSILKLLNDKVMPTYVSYSEGEMTKLVTTVINKSITNDITEELNIDKFFILKSDEITKTTMVDFDPVIINRIMSAISERVYNNLQLVEKKDKEALKKFNISEKIFYIPSGVAFNTVVLNNIGPRIPINMEVISSINPSIKTSITEYGINNSLIEIFIHVNVDIKMILPLYSDTISITVIVPLAVKLIQGQVPEYYQHGAGGSNLYFKD